MNPHRWFKEHSLKILAIRDTPSAIGGGVAIGVFFGFMPVPGVKTLSSIFFAWLTGSNILAAVISGALHDIFFPVMPALYFWEYELGYWLLSSPHQWPVALHRMNWHGPLWHFWDLFLSMGKPLLLGGLICSVPPSMLAYLATRKIVARHQQKRFARELSEGQGSSSPGS